MKKIREIGGALLALLAAVAVFAPSGEGSSPGAQRTRQSYREQSSAEVTRYLGMGSLPERVTAPRIMTLVDPEEPMSTRLPAEKGTCSAGVNGQGGSTEMCSSYVENEGICSARGEGEFGYACSANGGSGEYLPSYCSAQYGGTCSVFGGQNSHCSASTSDPSSGTPSCSTLDNGDTCSVFAPGLANPEENTCSSYSSYSACSSTGDNQFCSVDIGNSSGTATCTTVWQGGTCSATGTGSSKCSARVGTTTVPPDQYGLCTVTNP